MPLDPLALALRPKPSRRAHAGLPITVDSAQLGHADIAIAGRIYAYLVSDRDVDLAAAVFGGPISTGTMEQTIERQEPEDENPMGTAISGRSSAAL